MVTFHTGFCAYASAWTCSCVCVCVSCCWWVCFKRSHIVHVLWAGSCVKSETLQRDSYPMLSGASDVCMLATERRRQRCSTRSQVKGESRTSPIHPLWMLAKGEKGGNCIHDRILQSTTPCVSVRGYASATCNLMQVCLLGVNIAKIAAQLLLQRHIPKVYAVSQDCWSTRTCSFGLV